MANRITTRHGFNTPNTGNLLPYELGWDGTNLVLYINNNGLIVPINSLLMPDAEASYGTAEIPRTISAKLLKSTINSTIDNKLLNGVSGQATFNGSTTFNGQSTFNESITVVKDATFNDSTTFNGQAAFNDSATFNDEATFNDFVTFNSNIDDAKRRCYASLSSVGWYRVMTYVAGDQGGATGGQGLVVDFNIVRSTGAENHSITLRTVTGSGISFVNESSKSNTQLIDKIRYTYNTTTYEAYVDIHYTGTVSRVVGVFFNVYTSTLAHSKDTISNNLTAVADAPSGETVLTTYEFTENGFAPNQSILTSYGDLTQTGIVSNYVNGASVSVPTGTWTELCNLTLPVGTWLVWFTARFNSNATGYRQAQLGSSSASSSNLSVNLANACNAVNGTYTYVKALDWRKITSPTTFYLNAYQNSGSALAAIGRLYSMQIC